MNVPKALACVVLLFFILACSSDSLATDKVAFIVDSSLYTSCEYRILRYKAEVEALFPVELIICNDASFESYTPQQIRSYITSQYYTNSINGVVLVGQIQYRLWKNYAPGANDWGINSFYYEDLDGTFMDTDSDGTDDYHTWGEFIGPEVWCVWLRPPADNQVNALNTFLDKAHNYYFSNISFNHRALVAAHSDYDGNIRSGFSRFTATI